MRLLLCAAMLIVAASVSVSAGADLQSYFHKPDPAYRWEKLAATATDGGTIVDLHLVSQVWEGITWEHRLEIFRPAELKHPHMCLMLNTGGDGSASDRQMGMMIAQRSGCVFAILYGIPKQPLFGGLTEDALVVYTWQKYLDTGDEDWPLHFPMAKAVLKAMDAVQEYTRSAHEPAVSSFIITGASKRGWTTWLVGASRDPRVKAIAPMVIDTLHVAKQMPHQLAMYGKPSEQVDDYTNAGMIQKLQTPAGERLMQLEDPWYYRSILTLPKLLILGTNDRYWAQDALNIYWDDLVGPKYVSYTPNSGHGLEDKLHVLATLSAFADCIAGRHAWPKMQWTWTDSTDGATVKAVSDIAPRAGRLFRCFSSTTDFRDSHWTSEPMTAIPGGFSGTLATPATGYAATFGELEYEIDGHVFTLSTQMHILGLH